MKYLGTVVALANGIAHCWYAGVQFPELTPLPGIWTGIITVILIAAIWSKE